MRYGTGSEECVLMHSGVGWSGQTKTAKSSYVRKNSTTGVKIFSSIISIALTLFSLIPIYQYIGFSSFMIENESIISVVDEWGIFPMIIYSITGCVSILFLFDFVDLSIKKKIVIILILILFSLLIFIIYFIWSYVVIDKRYYLLFIFLYF